MAVFATAEKFARDNPTNSKCGYTVSGVSNPGQLLLRDTCTTATVTYHAGSVLHALYKLYSPEECSN